MTRALPRREARNSPRAGKVLPLRFPSSFPKERAVSLKLIFLKGVYPPFTGWDLGNHSRLLVLEKPPPWGSLRGGPGSLQGHRWGCPPLAKPRRQSAFRPSVPRPVANSPRRGLPAHPGRRLSLAY